MIVLGLTGSIGMGKSATADLFRAFDVPVYDADAAVHDLYAKGGAAVEPVGEAFLGVVVDGAIDRAKLRERVVGDAAAMRTLEIIVHPLTAKSQRAFRDSAAADGARLIVLDIPLLFETGGDARCDYTLVVTAPADVQRRRVLARPGMTEETLNAILEKQIPDAEKRARADFILNTAHGFDYARDCVQAIVELVNRMADGAETDA